MFESILAACEACRKNAVQAGLLSGEEKNAMLQVVCDALKANVDEILASNRSDIERTRESGKAEHFIDRLTLNETRMNGIAEGVLKLMSLEDPVGRVLEKWTVKSGLEISKVSVPLGVVGIIYEARPNVTVDAIALCLKSGNAVILRGSSETIETNRTIVNVIKKALREKGHLSEQIQLVEDVTRDGVNFLMKQNQYVDVLIPRGGGALIQNVVNNSTIPVIQTGVGNCHIYVETHADFEMAVDILVNAKVSRPSVCNAAESLLVDRVIAKEFLPLAERALSKHNVKIFGCEETCKILASAKPATEDDFYREYNDYKISVKVVENCGEAIAHINQYGTKHSEAIVTRDEAAAERFQREVDAAAVYVNASTRYTDGFEFGFGAEMGISTQKLHARGPMGLRELNTYKFTIRGNGQVRN